MYGINAYGASEYEGINTTSVYQVTFTENVIVSEVRKAKTYRTFLENLSFSESINSALVLVREFIDSLFVSESIKKSMTRLFSDTLTVVGSKKVLARKILTDSFYFIATKTRDITRTITDSVYIRPIRNFSISRTLTSIISVSETFLKSRIFGRVLIDYLIVTENFITKAKNFLKAVAKISSQTIIGGIKKFEINGKILGEKFIGRFITKKDGGKIDDINIKGKIK
jgi:hypothetical protein